MHWLSPVIETCGASNFGSRILQSTIYSCLSAIVYHHLTPSSSLGSRCVPWLGEGLSMPSPNHPVLCSCPLPYRVAPVFVQVVSPPLGWSPLSPFLVIMYGLQVVTREVHRLSLRRLICPAQDHFIFLTECTLYL